MKTSNKVYKLLGVLLFSVLLLTSCNENEGNIQPVKSKYLGLNEIYQLGINAEEAGKYHNEGLNIFMKNKPHYIYTDFDDLITQISKEFNNIHPDIFKNYSNYSPLNKVANLTAKSKKSIKSDDIQSFKEMISSLFTNFDSSDKVVIFLKKITDEELSYEDAKIFSNEYIINNSLSNEETEAITLFITVAKYSNKFWSKKIKEMNYDNSYKLKYVCDAGTQRYLADGIGFLFFGGFGGIGYSWAVYEFQDGGKHCI